MAVISSITDNFDDGSKDTLKWSSTTRAVGHTALNGQTEQGSTSETGGVLRMVPTDSVNTAFVGYSSTDTAIDFTAGRAYCRVSTVDNDSQSSFNLIAALSSNTNVRWFRGSVLRDAGSTRIEAQLFDGSSDLMTSIVYDSTNHRWISIRFAAPNWFFETAPDGVDALTPGSWTTQFTTRTAVGGMEVGTGMEIGLQTWNLNNATGILWEVDQFNLSGSGAPGPVLMGQACL